MIVKCGLRIRRVQSVAAAGVKMGRSSLDTFDCQGDEGGTLGVARWPSSLKSLLIYVEAGSRRRRRRERRQRAAAQDRSRQLRPDIAGLERIRQLYPSSIRVNINGSELAIQEISCTNTHNAILYKCKRESAGEESRQLHMS